jgi:3-oxoacyl-[acyl-carrier protein] reductase
MFSLEGKVSIVTGATSGIGKAAAIALAHQGSRVVVSGRRKAEGQAVVDSIKAAGGEAVFVRADVKQEADVRNLFEQAKAHYGRVDVAFLNSGVFEFAPLADQTEESLTHQIDTNIKGVYYGVKHAATHVADGGSVILNSSVVADLGFPGASAYSLTKGAVNTLARTAAVELAGRKVRVNAVAPGPIWTEGADAAFGGRESFDQNLGVQTLLGRGGEADEIAAAVVFLASDEAAFITGHVLAVDGGIAIK